MHTPQCIPFRGFTFLIPVPPGGQIEVPANTATPGFSIGGMGAKHGLAITHNGAVVVLIRKGKPDVYVYPLFGFAIVVVPWKVDDIRVINDFGGGGLPAYVWRLDLAALEAACPPAT